MDISELLKAITKTGTVAGNYAKNPMMGIQPPSQINSVPMSSGDLPAMAQQQPIQPQAFTQSADKNHPLDVTPAQPQNEKNDWLGQIVKSIPGIAKGAIEFAGRPEGFKTFAALTGDPYMKEALLGKGNEMQSKVDAENLLRTKAKIENETLAQRAALNPFSDTPIQSFDKAGNPVAVYMPKPEFAGLMNPKIIPLGDVQKEVPKPSISGDYILPGEVDPRPMNVVGGKIIDPKTGKDVTETVKVYVKPVKEPKSALEILNAQEAKQLSKAQQKAKTDLSDSVSTIDQLKGLEKILGKISPKGNSARVSGITRVALSKLLPDADMATYNQLKAQLLSNIARNFGGEKGVLSDPDIKRIEDGFPKPSDSKQEADAKMSTIYDLVNSRIYAKLRAVELKPEDVGFKPLVYGSTKTNELPPPREGERANGYIFKNGSWKQEVK